MSNQAELPGLGFPMNHIQALMERDKIDAVLRTLVADHGFDPVEAALGRIKVEMSGPVPSAPSRPTDPRTSVGSRMSDVRRFSRNSHSARLLTVFGRTAATDAEATVQVMGPPGDSVSAWEGCRRRCSDLRAAGYIEDTGLEVDDRVVWVITPAGERALNRLSATGWSR
jgi:hypothetical protein